MFIIRLKALVGQVFRFLHACALTLSQTRRIRIMAKINYCTNLTNKPFFIRTSKIRLRLAVLNFP